MIIYDLNREHHLIGSGADVIHVVNKGSQVTSSLGPVVNILAIFSNANILKKVRE